MKRLDVELVADLGEAMLDDVFSAGEGARCRTRLVCQCGMDVMRLLSSQLILCCCCCACFTMADLSPSPSRWQALCSLIIVLKLLPVSPM